MYKITWDKETGGVMLNMKMTNDALGVSPRPVFYEELDMLGMDKLGWSYPHCKEPLLWAINKQYFYRGNPCFSVKGANIYDTPTVELREGIGNDMTLQPVDVARMIEKNNEPMFLLESEAIEFIRDTYLTYSRTKKNPETAVDYEALALRAEKKTKRKMAIVREDCESFDVMPLETAKEQGKKIYQATRVDLFIASFSGGKDSQVVLDLCTRAIPPSEFQVIYSDTGYELPSSLELYEQVKRHYHNLFPSLRFSITRNHESVLSYWDKIGTPSDTHRWCCSVMKTAPLYRTLKIEGTNKQAKVLTFDGVRAEESTRRSNYNRVGKGVKHSTTINARPILMWNNVEIFLYLFRHELIINKAYRQGMTRVGCLICPFASEWNEMLANIKYPSNVKPFELRLREFAKNAGVRDIDDYIRQGGWKRRAGGNFVENDSNISFFSSDSTHFTAIITNPKKSILTFLWSVGKYNISSNGDTINGEVKVKNEIYNFLIKKNDKKKNIYHFEIGGVKEPISLGRMKKALYKATYCIQCEACEVECPTGAMHIFPGVKINRDVCIHCGKCLDFHDKGCIVANSLSITTNMKEVNNVPNIDRYKNFGLREEWLGAYLIDLDNYWNSNHGLNVNYQIPSLKCWLKDAEIIDDKCNVTELGKFLSAIYEHHPDVVWEIVWINLTYKSFIVKWFARNIRPGSIYTSKGIEEQVHIEYPGYKEKTVHNAVYQLVRTLRESPIGSKFKQRELIGKDEAKRNPYDDLSIEAMVYSLYKMKENRYVTLWNISDFFSNEIDGGPHVEFGISKESFKAKLRSIDAMPKRVLIAELKMGLESITLRDELDAITAVKEVLRK